MLYFKYHTNINAKIEFDQDSRRDFDIIRDYFKTENQAVKYMKSYRCNMQPYIYAITALGSYTIRTD